MADQRPDPGSMVSLCRDLVGLRKAIPDLHAGGYALHTAAGGLWAWRRGERTLVALNLDDAPAVVNRVQGVLRISTRRDRDEVRVDGTLELGSWEGAIVWLDEEPDG